MPDDVSTAEFELPFHVRVRLGVRSGQNWLQLVRFVTVGASGYVVNLGVFAACVHVFSIDYRVSAVIAFVVSVVNNFWLNRHWTFAAKDEHPMFQGARFFAVSLITFGFTYVVLIALVEGAGVTKVVAQAIAIACRHAVVVPRAEALELPGVRGSRIAGAPPGRRLTRSIALALALCALLAGGARAATSSTYTDPNAPVLVSSQNTPPTGRRLTAAEVRQIAAANPTARAELRKHPDAVPYEYTKGAGQWQVSWFSPGPNGRELLQAYVDDATGQVTEAWTGFQVAWTMARGYPGAFGRRVNALYVWLPLCVLFIAPFLPWRRRARGLWARPRREWSLLHLDLAVLLAFSVSLAFFNHATIGLSVPLAYPCLLYLLVRMLLLAFGRGVPRTPLRPAVPVTWLAVAVVFLVGFRVGLNVSNSNVIDVGYAGVIGADKLLHGQPLYGGWPGDNAYGDTYGPVNYYAYVPFRAIFGWSGTWDQLPAAHGAAIAFDLLTLLGLFWLGRRVRGPTLGVVLAYLWAAYPFTLYALSSNSNDALVSMLLVLALLVITSAPARGAVGALAGLTKFAPLALAPLLARGVGNWPRRRSLVAFAVAYVLTAAVVMLPVGLHDNWHAFWHDSIAYQAGRGSPFSIWGLWGGLGFAQHLVQGAAVALAVLVAFVPRRRTSVQVAALGAAVLIALQLGITHWFYLYIVWFFPWLIFALIAAHPERWEILAPRAEWEAHREPVVIAAA
jgi:putative flippase GtrA